MTRFDQRLERDFSGRIYDEGALAAGEFGLVSLKALIREAKKVTGELKTAGSVYELDLKEACEVITLETHLETVEHEIGRRNPRKVARKTRGMEFRQRFQNAPVIDETLELNIKI